MCATLAKLNLSRRPRSTRPMTEPEPEPEPKPEPEPEPFGGLEVGRDSHAAPPRMLVAVNKTHTHSGRVKKASLDQ